PENLGGDLVVDGGQGGSGRTSVEISLVRGAPVEPGALRNEGVLPWRVGLLVALGVPGDLREEVFPAPVVVQLELDLAQVLAASEHRLRVLSGIARGVEIDENSKKEGVEPLDLAPENHGVLQVGVRVDLVVLRLMDPPVLPLLALF